MYNIVQKTTKANSDPWIYDTTRKTPNDPVRDTEYYTTEEYNNYVAPYWNIVGQANGYFGTTFDFSNANLLITTHSFDNDANRAAGYNIIFGAPPYLEYKNRVNFYGQIISKANVSYVFSRNF